MPRFLTDDRKFMLVGLVPPLIPIFLFTVYPLAYALYVSLLDLDLRKPVAPFVGFDNYIYVLSDPSIQFSWYVTGIFTMIVVPLSIGMGLGLALLLSRPFKGVSFLQTLVLVPWAIPYVVSGTIWKWLFDSSYGIMNWLLLRLGLIESYQPWLVQPWPAMIILVMAYIWVEVPLDTLLFLAALQSVPHELYEAARIDRAGPLARFRYISFVWIRPMFFIVIVYETLMALRAFDLVYVITAGGPADFTALLSFFTYRLAFVGMHFGRATALCVLILIVSFILLYIYYKLLRIGALRLRVR